MITRFVLVVLLLGTFGCSRATYIQATVTDNPLDRVEQQAQEEDWSIERVNSDTLHLSNAWIFSSIVNLGYSVSHAHLVYDQAYSVLYIQYYLRTFSLFTLFIPTTIDMDYRRHRLSYHSRRMDKEIDDILRWSEISVAWKRRVKRSDIFPPARPLPLPPQKPDLPPA